MEKIPLIIIGIGLFLYASEYSNRYSKNNGVVTDSITDMQWQDDYSDNNDTVKKATWQDALIYCHNLSLDNRGDWRLPSIRDLKSIVDDTKSSPPLNPIFTNIVSNANYWSSSTKKSDTNYAWGVYFEGGSDTWYSKTEESYVRCVRGGYIDYESSNNINMSYVQDGTVLHITEGFANLNQAQQPIFQFNLYHDLGNNTKDAVQINTNYQSKIDFDNAFTNDILILSTSNENLESVGMEIAGKGFMSADSVNSDFSIKIRKDNIGYNLESTGSFVTDGRTIRNIVAYGIQYQDQNSSN